MIYGKWYSGSYILSLKLSGHHKNFVNGFKREIYLRKYVKSPYMDVHIHAIFKTVEESQFSLFTYYKSITN